MLGPEGKRDELVGDRREARERQCAVDELFDDDWREEGRAARPGDLRQPPQFHAGHRLDKADLVRRQFPQLRPIEVEVSICWVTDTMPAPCREAHDIGTSP